MIFSVALRKTNMATKPSVNNRFHNDDDDDDDDDDGNEQTIQTFHNIIESRMKIEWENSSSSLLSYTDEDQRVGRGERERNSRWIYSFIKYLNIIYSNIFIFFLISFSRIKMIFFLIKLDQNVKVERKKNSNQIKIFSVREREREKFFVPNRFADNSYSEINIEGNSPLKLSWNSEVNIGIFFLFLLDYF